jgi:hypothetical protein
VTINQGLGIAGVVTNYHQFDYIIVEDLLGNISILLDVLLDQDEYFLVVWGNSVDLIKGICEAINQCGTSLFIADMLYIAVS